MSAQKGILSRIDASQIEAEQLHAIAQELEEMALSGEVQGAAERAALTALEAHLATAFTTGSYPSLAIYPLPPKAYGRFLDAVIRLNGEFRVAPYLSSDIPLVQASVVAATRTMARSSREWLAYLASRPELLTPDLLAALPPEFLRQVVSSFEYPSLRRSVIDLMVCTPDVYVDVLSSSIEPESLRRLLDASLHPELMIASRPELFLPFLWGEPDQSVSIWLRAASLQTMASLCDAAKRLLMAMRSGIGRDLTHLVQERERQLERWLDTWHQAMVLSGIRAQDMGSAIAASPILKSLPLTRRQLSQGDAALFQSLSGQVTGAPSLAVEVLRAWRIYDDLISPIENTALRYLRRWLGNDPDPDVARSLQAHGYPMWWSDTPYGRAAALDHLDQLARSAPEEAIRLLPLICSYHRPDADFDRALALQVRKINPEILMDHDRLSGVVTPSGSFPLVLSALSMVGVASATRMVAEMEPDQLPIAQGDKEVFLGNLLASKSAKSSPSLSRVLVGLIDESTRESSLLFILEHWSQRSDPRVLGSVLACCMKGGAEIAELSQLMLVLKVLELSSPADVELLLSQFPQDALSFLAKSQWMALLSPCRPIEVVRGLVQGLPGGALCLEAVSLIDDGVLGRDLNIPLLVQVLLSANGTGLRLNSLHPAPECGVSFEVA